jgi:hypothetical protein
MKIAAWVVAILLLVAGLALFIEALTTTNSVWLSIPLLALSGGPAIIAWRCGLRRSTKIGPAIFSICARMPLQNLREMQCPSPRRVRTNRSCSYGVAG